MFASASADGARNPSRSQQRTIFGCALHCVLVASSLLGSEVAHSQHLPPTVQWPEIAITSPVRTINLLGPAALTLGAVDGPDTALFAGVVGAAKLSDGRIAVADASRGQVLYFSGSGTFVASVGRLGDGPLEFRIPRWFGSCGTDSVALYDAAHAAFTVLASDGRFIRRVRVPAGLGFDHPIGCSHDKGLTLILNSIRTRVQPGDRLMTPTAVARVSDSPKIDTIASGGTQQYYVARAIGAFTEVPLGQATLAAAGRDLLYVAENSAGVVRVFERDGSARESIDLGIKRARVSRAQWERALLEKVDAEPLERTRKVLRVVLAELSAPQHLPAIHSLAADSEDNVWVRTYDTFGAEFATWVVLSREGKALARVVTPSRLKILEIGRDYLLAMRKDRDDVESVVLYRFQPISMR